MNKLLGWLPAVVAIQMCLSEGTVCAQSAGVVTAPSIFWRDNQWQVWKDGNWVPYHQELLQPVEGEATAEEMAPYGEAQPEPQLESDGSMYWMGGYGYGGIYRPPGSHGNWDRRHRPIHHRRPGGTGNGNSGNNGNAGGDRRGIGIGQPTIGIGQTTIGIGQRTIGIGQPTIAIGQPTIGIGQPNTGIGQTTIGIGQQGGIAPGPQNATPTVAKPGTAIAQRHESSGSRHGGRN